MAPPAGLPADLEQQVRGTPGVAAVAAFETGTVAVDLPGAPGDGEVWSAVTAVDGPLARFPAVIGKLPAGPREAALSEAAARRTGLEVGDSLALVGPARAGGGPGRHRGGHGAGAGAEHGGRCGRRWSPS